MIWKPGTILRIRNFRFEDDGSTRDKYGIVLSVNNNESYVLFSLTTSQNNFGFPALNYGCSVHKFIPYYFIPKNQLIGNDGYFFDKDTFIFFTNNVRKIGFNNLASLSNIPFGVVSLGVLNNQELSRLLKCILKSNAIPLNSKTELIAMKDSIGRRIEE